MWRDGDTVQTQNAIAFVYYYAVVSVQYNAIHVFPYNVTVLKRCRSMIL